MNFVHFKVSFMNFWFSNVRFIRTKFRFTTFVSIGFLKNKNCLYLTYEDDIQKDPIKAYFRTLEFVSLEPWDADLLKVAHINIHTSKNNYSDALMKDKIENFKDVSKVLCNTPFKWMLNTWKKGTRTFFPHILAWLWRFF